MAKSGSRSCTACPPAVRVMKLSMDQGWARRQQDCVAKFQVTRSSEGSERLKSCKSQGLSVRASDCVLRALRGMCVCLSMVCGTGARASDCVLRAVPYSRPIPSVVVPVRGLETAHCVLCLPVPPASSAKARDWRLLIVCCIRTCPFFPFQCKG